MTTNIISDQVCGKTIRLSWTAGPTKGTIQEHIFHTDGTVEWHSIEHGASHNDAAAGKAVAKPAAKVETPHYAGMKITDDVCMVSYLSDSGYTLTVALNFDDGTANAIASNEKDWVPARGCFEVVS